MANCVRLAVVGLGVLAGGLWAQVYPVETYPMLGEQSVLQVLHEGRDGTIWVGMASGLYRLAGGKVVAANVGMPRTRILGMASEGSRVWMATGQGMYGYQPGEAARRVLAGSMFTVAERWGHLYFTAVYEKGLQRIRAEDCWQGRPCKAEIVLEDGRGEVTVGADGRIWVGCGLGICAVDERGQVERMGEAEGVPRNEWHKCLMDGQGTLWGMAQAGFFRRGKGERELRFQLAMRRVGDRVSMHLDSKGFLLASGAAWVYLGGESGLLLPVTAFGFGDGNLYGILRDSAGEVWLGSYSGSVARMKAKGNVAVWDDRHGLPSLASNFLETPDGSVWGGAVGQVVVLRPGEAKWRSIPLGEAKGMPRLWWDGGKRIFGQQTDAGYFALDVETLSVRRVGIDEVHPQRGEMILPTEEGFEWVRKMGGGEERLRVAMEGGGGAFRSALSDEEGRLWVVSMKGLMAVNRDGTQRLFTTLDGLRMNALQAATIGKNGELWFGYDLPSDTAIVSLPKGRVDVSTKLAIRHLQPLSAEEGIFAFGWDGRGRIWKGTDRGIFIAEPPRVEKGEWAQVSEAEGLPHPDIYMYSFLRSRDGSISISSLGRAKFARPEELFEPGKIVRLNGVFENGVVRVGIWPAGVEKRVKLEWRKREWFAKWQLAEGTEFEVESGVAGVEVRVKDDYFHRGVGVLELGGASWPRWVWWLGGLAGALGFWMTGTGARLRYWWRKHQYAGEEETNLRAVEEIPEGTVLRERFAIEERLARGNFSDVYGAVDLEKGRDKVVVKRLKLPEFGGDFTESWLKRRFMQEVGAAGMLQHPGVLPVIEAWIEAPGSPFIVMRRVNGPTLRSYFNEHGRIEVGLALDLLGQVVEVVEAAHARGIVHCDLKPENLMIERQGERWRVLVIDFGTSALRLEADSLSHYTRPAGSVRYMAPEQLLGKYSTASDVYAFALIALEALCGETYADWEIDFNDRWDEELKAKLAEKGYGEAVAIVFREGLRFSPEERAQDIRVWYQNLVRSLEIRW